MSSLDALLMGILQGLTEFFPVSSSGHLKLCQHLLGLENLDRYVLFDLFCHLGTLLAILIVFRREIIQTLFVERSRLALVAIATLPLFPLVLVLSPLKESFAVPENLSIGFLFTATLLFLGERFANWAAVPEPENNRASALVIGIFQALAVIPGISRSGSTISAARLLGWNRTEAARFSFLMAIPAICGGVVLEVIELVRGHSTMAAAAPSAYLVGFFTSFIVGLGALLALMRLVEKGRLSVFVWYCLSLSFAWTLYLSWS
jgi:undecaprenyl-diphosphatase